MHDIKLNESLTEPSFEGFAKKVSDVIQEHFDLNHSIDIQLPDVARKLTVSRRTLQRRLNEENISFSYIVDKLRRYNACLLISQSKPFCEIADSLGYKDKSILGVACKRWFNMTLSEARRHCRFPSLEE